MRSQMVGVDFDGLAEGRDSRRARVHSSLVICGHMGSKFPAMEWN